MVFHTHPIFIGISLVVSALISGRLCFFCEGETIIWVLLLSIGLFFGGLLVLKGYWKNNVSNLNTQHNINGFGGRRYRGRF